MYENGSNSCYKEREKLGFIDPIKNFSLNVWSPTSDYLAMRLLKTDRRMEGRKLRDELSLRNHR